jgi:phage baseplate assembly protein W
MDIDFPFHIDSRGRTAACEHAAHVRDLLEQLLFTSPGERVNRPDFGSGLLQLVFAPNSPEVAAALQFTARAAIQQWLGDVLAVEDLQVASEDAVLRVTVRYTLRSTGASRSETFQRSLA